MSPLSALQSLVVALAVAVWIALPILPTDSHAALPEIDEPLLVSQADDSDSDSEEDSDEPELREGKPRGDVDEDSDSDGGQSRAVRRFRGYLRSDPAPQC